MTDDTPAMDSEAAYEGADADAPIVPVSLVTPQTLDATLAALPPHEANWARINAFGGKLGQVAMLPEPSGGISRVLFGWGDAAARSRDRLYLGDFARRAPAGTYVIETPLDADDAEQAALGWLLGRYYYGKYKAGGPEADADLQVPEGVDQERLVRVTEGVFLTRDLINTPANDMGPADLAGTASKLAARHGARIAIVEGEALLAENFPLIHAVGRAGAQAPRLIDMTWGADDAPKVTLVGKGVCFDTGGLNLKPGGSMALMKKDMGGAATVLGLAHMVMGLGLPIRLRVLIPAVENAVSAAAMRPGDILTARNGMTIEVNNTDAEGRLVLADALCLATEDAPELLIDMATLTGAARVALGPDLVPFYAPDDDLAVDLARASRIVSDPIWRLPLWAPYERDIEPGIADLDNAPKGGMAGSITAALFLQRFAGKANWAHFDIYGWTPAAKPGRPKGGACQAARAILHMLEQRYPRGA